MKIKPLQDWAVIQRIEPKEMTAAGIVIPEMAKDKPTEGIVLAIGPGKFVEEKGKEKKKKFVSTVLKPGQRIMYGKYSAREFELDGEPIVLVREEDVLGTVEETQLVEKQPFAVEEKRHQPVTVKQKNEVMAMETPEKEKKIPPPAKKRKTPKKKTPIKAVPAVKATARKEKKKPVAKKTAKVAQKKMVKTSKTKAPVIKPAAKKTVRKPLKKAVSPKKVKGPEKKTAVKKTVAKKKVVKKTVPAKKKTLSKKTVVKPVKKSVTKKNAPAKKKTTAKKPVAKVRTKR